MERFDLQRIQNRTYLDIIEDLRALRPVEFRGDDDGDVVVAARREVEAHARKVASRLAHRAGEAADEDEGDGGRRGHGQLESLHVDVDQGRRLKVHLGQCHFSWNSTLLLWPAERE